MAKPNYYEVSAVNVRGISIVEPRRVYTLEDAISQVIECCKPDTYISYDKVWRKIKQFGSWCEVVALKAGLFSIQGGLAVIIIAPEGAQFIPQGEKPVRSSVKGSVPDHGDPKDWRWVHSGPAAEEVARLTGAAAQPLEQSPASTKKKKHAPIPEYWPYAGSLDIYEDMGVKKGHPVQEEPVTYAWRVFYSKLNHVTKQLHKKEHHVVIDAWTEQEARRIFDQQQKEFGAAPAFIIRIEPAGQL